jgi:hypothetical protein
MTDKNKPLVAAIVRGIRPELAVMRAEARAEFGDIKARLSAFEVISGQLFTLDAAKSKRLDRLEERVDRIERRQ